MSEEDDPITMNVLDEDEFIEDETMDVSALRETIRDSLDFSRTVELSVDAIASSLTSTVPKARQSHLTTTSSIPPMLEAKTQERAVPKALLRAAQPTSDFPAPETYVFEGIIDKNGRFQVPEEYREVLQHRVVKVVVVPEEN
jgi:hypothetical protein